MGQKRAILSWLKRSLGQSGCESGQFDPYFSHEYIYIYIDIDIK